MVRKSLAVAALVWLAANSSLLAQYGPYGPGGSAFDSSPYGPSSSSFGPDPYLPQVPDPMSSFPRQGAADPWANTPNPWENMSGPQIPSTPQFEPQFQYVETKVCTSCDKEVPDSARVGQRCPHCGVLWTTDETASGSSNSTYAATGSELPKSTLYGLGAVMALALVGGVIYAAMRRPNYAPAAPSAPYASPPYAPAGKSPAPYAATASSPSPGANPFLQRPNDRPWGKS